MRISPNRHRLALSSVVLLASCGLGYAQSPMFARPFGAQEGQAGLGMQPAIAYASPDDTVRINASIGAMYLEGNEKVVTGNYTLSHLIWQTTTPVLRGSLAVDFAHGFSASVEASTAMFGSSYMEDYDWLLGDDTFANWSHRSQHPDTHVDHYFTGAALLGYELVNDGSAVIRAHGGFRYSDVQWTAYGGTYVYSDLDFRDTSGNFAPGTPGITYRQQFPELVLGFDGEENYGNFRVGGLLRGGVTFLATATDDHWMRNLRFVDSLYMAPTFTAGVDIGYKLGSNAELTLAARYDHIFEQRGDTKYYDIATGTQTGGLTDVAAAALRSAEVTAGFKGWF